MKPRFGRLVCEGLQYAHDRRDERTGEPMKLVHRDVTPDNILFARNGTVKVADFGIAKASNQLHQTRPGDIKGKLQYIAPEQLLGQPIDARADVFSLGVVLHQMLSGAGPFTRENDAAVMEAIIHDEVPPLNALRAEAPAGLDAIIRKATAKRREERWQSAAELQAAIDRALLALSPAFGPAQLRELVELLDPAPGPSGDEETTTEAAPVDVGDDPPGPVPVGRAPTRDDVPVSVDIPITGAVAMPLPPPRRSVAGPVLVAVVLTAALAGGTAYFVARETTPVVMLPPPEPVVVAAPAPVDAGTPPEPERVAEPEPVVEAPPPAEIIEPLEGRARVMLQSTPEANVFIDGKAVGRTPLALPVRFGSHKVRFEDTAAGLSRTVKLEVPKEREYSKAFVFEKARLFVLAPNGANVFLGKRKIGQVPKPVALYEGTHVVRVVYEPTGLDVTKTLVLKAGDRFEPFDGE